MNSTKLDDLFTFLSEHNFEIDENVPDKLICGKCDKLLINSYVGPCLCRYCRKCIDEMLTDGTENCPGETDDCIKEQLSTFLSDNHTNFKISKLERKCPEQTCSHKCEISKMEEHLRVCTNKCAKCPLHKCDHGRLSTDELRELHQIIENLRNEINVLEENIETNKLNIEINMDETSKNVNKIELLKENEEMTDESIAAMDEEIQTNKRQIKEISKENAKMKNETIPAMNVEIRRNHAQIEILRQLARTKDETIAVVQKEIKSLKMENQQITAQVHKYKSEMGIQMANLIEKMTKEWGDSLVQNLTKINDEIIKLQSTHRIGGGDKCHLLLAKRFTEMEKWLDKQMDGTVVMRIDQISDKNRNGACMLSDVFYPRSNPYKMQLWMGNGPFDEEFGVGLVVHSGEHDDSLQWPFHGNITIEISNKARPDASIVITKHYTIPQPDDFSYRRCKPFKFSYAELLRAGLRQDDYIIIGCRVE